MRYVRTNARLTVGKFTASFENLKIVAFQLWLWSPWAYYPSLEDPRLAKRKPGRAFQTERANKFII